MEKRLKEIQERKLEIRAALKSDATLNLDEAQKELEALDAEETEIRKKLDVANKIKIGDMPSVGVDKPKDSEERGAAQNKFASAEYRKAFYEYVKTGAMPAEFRDNAYSTTATTSAGYAIPEQTMNIIVEKLSNNGMILPTVTRTAYQAGVAIPISTVKPKATWVAERATSDIQEKKIGRVTFGAYKLRCAVGVSLEVDVLSIDALEATIAKNIADAMVEALENAIINGAGAGEPTGILKATVSDEQKISVAAVDYDALLNAEGALPAQYENGSVYVMAKKTFLSLKGVKDDNKRPILDSNDILTKNLLGRPVILCDYLPSFASAKAGDVFAFIFRMSDYVLNTAYNITLKQYEDDVTDDIVRKAILLADGKVVDNNSLVTLVKA